MDELRLALRRLTKRPAATLASIATLACAIGAAAVTWSTISAVLLNPLPIRHPEQVVIVSTMAMTGPAAGTLHSGAMYPYYPYVSSSGIFEGVAAAWSPMALLTETGGGAPERAQVAFVTHDYFDLLGVAIPRGRGFNGDDDRRGTIPVAVLSDRYWDRMWGRDPSAIGRTMVINKVTVTIVGVASSGFRGLHLAQAPDVYLPFHVIPDVGGGWTNYLSERTHQSSPTSGVTIVARLAAGTSPAQATARLAALAPPADERLRGTLAVSPVNVEALPQTSRAAVAQFSRLLAATVGLLLFIGCTTVGLLLLLRTEARREEFAMCLALGASRGRLARGVALEGFVLALCGATLALPVALWLFELVQAYQLPGGVTIELLDLSLDGAVLAAAGGAGVAAVVLISLIAGVFGFRADLADALRAKAGATPRAARRAARTALITAQVAVALFLLAGAGLFARSLTAALNLNAGLDPARLIPVSVALAPYGYTPERAAAFFDELQARLAANPSIHSVSATVGRGGMGGAMPIDGVPRKFPTNVDFTAVDQHYFETLGTRVLSGRNFSADDRATSPFVGIVSESFGRLLADGGSPIGRRITMPYRIPPAPAPQVEIVGVVPDVIASVRVMEPLVLYLPMAQQYPIGS
ncbi:MAG: ABC transporter permease, partial [Vicinamibacterales bacterium]